MKNKKIFFVILIILVFILTAGNTIVCEAANAGGTSLLDMYDGIGEDADDGITEARKIIGRCISIVQVFGIFIAVAMCIILGIKYMYSSPGDRAQIKNHLTVYVVGAIVMFGAAGILEIVKAFYTGIKIS